MGALQRFWRKELPYQQFQYWPAYFLAGSTLGRSDLFFSHNFSFSLELSRIRTLQLWRPETQAQQINLGSGFEYAFSDNFKGFAGAWTRVVGGIDGFKNDAAIVTIGGEVSNTRVGISYDFNTSGFRGASKSVGALEISVVYIHKQEEPGRINYERFCPTF